MSQWNKGVIIKLILLLLFVLLIILLLKCCSSKSEEESESTVISVEKLDNTIALPQFESLNLRADTLSQEITFKNPEQNFVQFRVSILLNGETLWQSEMIRPGETSARVELAKPLSAGTYENAVLKYECFLQNEEMTPKNGAESPVKLRVK